MLEITISIFFIIFNPYYLIFVISILNIFKKIESRIVPFSIALGLSIFWSSRPIGGTWENGGDDVVGYIEIFKNISNSQIFSLFNEALINPKGNEPLFILLNILISTATLNEIFFVWITYLIIAFLTIIAARIISRRYYLLALSILLFGVGGYGEQSVLHLWRSTISSLLFFIGAAMYANKYFPYKIFLASSLLFHIAAVPANILLLIFSKFKKNKILVYSILISVIFAISLIYIFLFFDQKLFNAYFSSEDTNLTSSLVLLFISLFNLINSKDHSNMMDRMPTLIALATLICLLTFPTSGSFVGRITTFYILFFNRILFKIILSIPSRYIIAIVVTTLFFRKITAFNTSESLSSLFPGFFRIFLF
jgi:hypothetical protein